MEKIKINKVTSLNGNDVLKVNEYFGEEALQFITENGSDEEIKEGNKIFEECKNSYLEKATEKLLKKMVGKNLKLNFKTVEFGGIGNNGQEIDQRVWVPCDPDFEPVRVQQYVEPHRWSSDGYEAHEEYEITLIQLNNEYFVVKDNRFVTYNGTDYNVDIFKCPQIK